MTEEEISRIVFNKTYEKLEERIAGINAYAVEHAGRNAMAIDKEAEARMKADEKLDERQRKIDKIFIAILIAVSLNLLSQWLTGLIPKVESVRNEYRHELSTTIPHGE